MITKYESYTIGEDRRIPSFRIAVTGACPLKCHYCPTDGDNYLLHGKRFLDKDDFSHIVKLANETGIRHYSITGGEPLAVPKVTFPIAQTISQFEDLGYLRLNTNGVGIIDNSEDIEKSRFHLIKVSIDSLRTGKYQLQTSKKTPQSHVNEVLGGVQEMKKRNISVRINMVVGKYNVNEVLEMMDFCETNNLELKLFDITYYRDALSNQPNFWKDNYQSLLPLANELERRFGKPRIVYAVGGFGNPMPIFKPDSTSPIRVRISENSAMYVDKCPECQDYMCQDGFCNITLTTDGNLKTCRPEGLDLNLNLVDSNGKLLDDTKIKERIKKAILLFQETHPKQRTLEEMMECWGVEPRT
jgi:cyclic pyranopterin phosphate synthase